ncbi:uncharacterized protein MELLADRAFT_90500 [Melampsora larici-populina 98AG31]|uniref:Uncharacterized protein n=1 Tax=Melampsora larici-populina (strain 98AG31 / pathotype 3-4-7) TaxID=747676 RepID=F4RX47_MELLP|nr:uncharacterized protein MELLADRAFT_90500 [Melampsora larici-populina 98AG31]EGG02901.1 hypothetical protein MELLADRAFT_90500 [Melampsora larici-populina 98AG31]
MHTAANDTRTASTWRGCDNTGLLGMVCRHDHALAFINIEKSGEKAHFAHTMVDWLLDRAKEPDDERPRKCAFLYDIGCNLEKGIKKVSLRIMTIHDTS